MIDGGIGNDRIIGSQEDDSLMGGEGDDHLIGGSGSDDFFVQEGHGNDTIDGGQGWTDNIEIMSDQEGVSTDMSNWTVDVDSTYTITDNTMVFDQADAVGTITFSDGSQINFNGIETIHW